jgi:hypothetical protein
MVLNQEKFDGLKKAHPEGIYEEEMTFSDAEDKFHKVEFIYRKPTVADIEAFSKASQKNVMVANLNLLQSLVVYPEPGSVIDAIKDFPLACAKFVEEAVTPFFGSNVTRRTKKL